MTIGDVELRRHGRPVDLSESVRLRKGFFLCERIMFVETHTFQIELLNDGVKELGVIRWHLSLKLPDHMTMS